jgi:hypothetical protein
MKFEIKHKITGEIKFSAEIECEDSTPPSIKIGLAIKLAIKARADLTEANLYGANLTGADLAEANLAGANLYRANLTRANLTEANLYGANLTEANLYGANLYGANMDMSCWPLSCGGTMVKISMRMSLQLIYHAFNQTHEDKDVLAALEPLRPLAERFHSEFRKDSPKLRK